MHTHTGKFIDHVLLGEVEAELQKQYCVK